MAETKSELTVEYLKVLVLLAANNELRQRITKLEEACNDALLWLENVDCDYSNGNVAPNGMDEGEVLGAKGHIELTTKLSRILRPTPPEEES